MIAHDIDFFREMVAQLPDKQPPVLISQYVEGRRNLPTNTPLSGFWQNSRAPYLRVSTDSLDWTGQDNSKKP